MWFNSIKRVLEIKLRHYPIFELAGIKQFINTPYPNFVECLFLHLTTNQTNIMADKQSSFRPFVLPETKMAEFTLKSILTGAAFGIIFGAATVYLALKAGLTVSASIPIAVIAITLGRKF